MHPKSRTQGSPSPSRLSQPQRDKGRTSPDPALVGLWVPTSLPDPRTAASWHHLERPSGCSRLHKGVGQRKASTINS